jgi:type I restriction enzyme M protein
MQDITKLEKRLWEAADQLRANSKLTQTEYSMPVLGLIFLRYAYNRFLLVKEEIKKNLPSRGGKTRAMTKEDYKGKAALYLPEKSRYDYLINLPQGNDPSSAVNEAMEAIEEVNEQLLGILPKDYQIFDNDLLDRLLKIFNDEALQKATGDVFGQIYEYFLMNFAMAGAGEKGEFFTPVSLVQTIVNVIEPNHGIVFDPACGSGGMFVQTGHFMHLQGKNPQQVLTFYGQEKTATTIRLVRMNLAVHGLEGKIAEANTFYQDEHNLFKKADFVMANPPFNVDGVDAEKVKADPRLLFGLPGVNKKKQVSNGNYLWISYFYSYMNKNGRAGFVMSSQASSAGGGESEVRRKLIETGAVDVMIAIRSNFFNTLSVPCELWFLNNNKPAAMKDNVLMIDARNTYRMVTRRVYDFSPE